MKGPKGKHAWTARVGEKGQIVIPKEAREIFGIEPGDTLLILGDESKGLAIVKGSMFSEIFEKVLSSDRREDEDEKAR